MEDMNTARLMEDIWKIADMQGNHWMGKALKKEDLQYE